MCDLPRGNVILDYAETYSTEKDSRAKHLK